jgi:hypothetical protein
MLFYSQSGLEADLQVTQRKVSFVRKAASRNFAQVTGGTPEADWEPSVRWRTLDA